MDPPRPPRPYPRPPPMPREEPESLPPMRPKTPSGHDDWAQRLANIEDRMQRHEVKCAGDKAEDRAQFASLRMRTESVEAAVVKLKGELEDTGQHVMDGTVAASTYKAVIEEERRKRAEVETALEKKNAEVQREKRLDTLQKIMSLIVGALVGGVVERLLQGHLP